MLGSGVKPKSCKDDIMSGFLFLYLFYAWDLQHNEMIILRGRRRTVFIIYEQWRYVIRDFCVASAQLHSANDS